MLASPVPISFPTAPLAERETSVAYIKDLLEYYSLLSSFPNLHPCPEVNEVFEKLVAVCVQVKNESVIRSILADRQIGAITSHLQYLCAEGEFNLETFWARKLTSDPRASSQSASTILSQFPYYENYLSLTHLELRALSSCLTTNSFCRPRKFAFIGCGPLPLTSLCIFYLLSSPPCCKHATASESAVSAGFHQATHKISSQCNNEDQGIQILNIDRDPLALKLAMSLCKSLQFPSATFRFLCADVQNLAPPLTTFSSPPATGTPAPPSLDNDSETYDLFNFDVVYLASLVGTSGPEKRQILRDLVSKMKPGALVVVRSAWGLRGLIYPVVNATQDLEEDGFLEVLLVVHPYNHVVNSVIVARVKERPATGPEVVL